MKYLSTAVLLQRLFFSHAWKLDVGRTSAVPADVCLSCVATCYTVSAVELQNGQIVSKSGGENEERWRPWTPRCVPSVPMTCSFSVYHIGTSYVTIFSHATPMHVIEMPVGISS